MKKLILVFILLLAHSVFAQQFLWSTVRRENLKHVSMNNVTREVLEFYDHYRWYCDLTGFSKDRFVNEMSDYGFEDLGWLNEIEEPTVFALRSNSGNGSVVFVMSISRDNVNMIIFTNSSRDCGLGGEMTLESDRTKFSRWFRTLLN